MSSVINTTMTGRPCSAYSPMGPSSNLCGCGHCEAVHAAHVIDNATPLRSLRAAATALTSPAYTKIVDAARAADTGYNSVAALRSSLSQTESRAGGVCVYTMLRWAALWKLRVDLYVIGVHQGGAWARGVKLDRHVNEMTWGALTTAYAALGLELRATVRAL